MRGETLEGAEQDILEKVRIALTNMPQLGVGFRGLLSIKQEDYGRLKSFLSQPEIQTAVDTYRFFNKALDYLPRDTRPNVWVCIVNLWTLANQLGVEPEIVAKTMSELLDPKSDPATLVQFVNDLEDVRQHYAVWSKRLFYAARNARFLTGIVTASDLRAVYKEDFSAATNEMEYDPVLDLEGLTPVANIRLAINNNEFNSIVTPQSSE